MQDIADFGMTSGAYHELGVGDAMEGEGLGAPPSSTTLLPPAEITKENIIKEAEGGQDLSSDAEPYKVAYKVVQKLDEEGRATYIILDAATNIRIEGTPDYATYEAAMGVVRSGESNVLIREEIPSLELMVRPYEQSDGTFQYFIVDKEIPNKPLREYGSFDTLQSATDRISGPDLTSLQIYENAEYNIDPTRPVEETYLIKIRGMLGSFRVKAVDLKYIPKDKIITQQALAPQDRPSLKGLLGSRGIDPNQKVSIMLDDGKRSKGQSRKPISRFRLEEMFGKFNESESVEEPLVEKPPVQKLDLRVVMFEFLTEAGTTDREKLAELWPDYAMQAGVSVLDADKILANIQK